MTFLLAFSHRLELKSVEQLLPVAVALFVDVASVGRKLDIASDAPNFVPAAPPEVPGCALPGLPAPPGVMLPGVVLPGV